MVERYRFWCQDSDAEISREPNGGWVRHSDYAALERQIAELRDHCNAMEVEHRQAIEEMQAAEAHNARLSEALRKIEYSLTKDSLCEAEKIDDALYMVRRALSAAAPTATGGR
jgi:hypothetical protein